MTNDESKCWDDLADTWDKEEGTEAFSCQVFNIVESLCPELKEQTVLDFGCGTGLLTTKLVGVCREVVAVDLSPKMIEKVKEKIPTIEGYALDIKQATNALKRRFDLIVASSVLRFTTDLEGTFAVLVDCMKQNGTFLQFDWPNALESSDDHQSGFNSSIVQNLYTKMALTVKDVRKIQFKLGNESSGVLFAIGQKSNNLKEL